MRRAVLVVVGALMLVVGLAVGAAGVLLHVGFGAGGRQSLATWTIPALKQHALVIDIERFTGRLGALSSLGETRLAFTSGGRPLQVAVDYPAAVDTALAGRGYAVARLEDGSWRSVAVPGPAPASSRAGEDSWPELAAGSALVTARGTSPEVRLPAQRPISVLISSPEVLETVQASAVFVLAQPRTLEIGAGVASGVLVLCALVLIGLGVRQARARARHASPDAG